MRGVPTWNLKWQGVWCLQSPDEPFQHLCSLKFTITNYNTNSFSDRCLNLVVKVVLKSFNVAQVKIPANSIYKVVKYLFSTHVKFS